MVQYDYMYVPIYVHASVHNIIIMIVLLTVAVLFKKVTQKLATSHMFHHPLLLYMDFKKEQVYMNLDL